MIASARSATSASGPARRITSTALRIGASGLRSSWESVARNSSLRRSDSRSTSSTRFRSVTSTQTLTQPHTCPLLSYNGSTSFWM